MKKTILQKCKSKFGEFELTVPRDRNSEFAPQIIPRNKRNISGIEDKVINLYGKCLSTKEISDSIEDIYVSKTKLEFYNQTNLKVWEDKWEAVCTLFNYSKE